MSEQIAVYQESIIELEERVQVLRNGAEELLSILKSQFGETDLRDEPSQRNMRRPPTFALAVRPAAKFSIGLIVA